MNYVASTSGFPCWYELGAADVDAASTFYTNVLGWSVVSAEMPGMDYRLANAPDGHAVAGMMDVEPGTPPAWMFYLEVADCDAFAAAVTKAGGSVVVEPTDIPGTGRFAMCIDPQGAAFGALQPDPMEGEALDVSAYSTEHVAHGAWQELMTSDPKAAFSFYAGLVGWTKGELMPMGNDGSYQIFQAKGADIGGIHGQGQLPAPSWLVYFGVPSVQEASAAITAGGGSIIHGPAEVPGLNYITIGTDPGGAMFGVVGPLA